MSEDGILLDPDNMAKILNWPVSKMVHKGRCIQGLGSYYCHFIWDFSDWMWPLVVQTKRDKPFQWTKECQRAFQDIKGPFVGPDVMIFPTNDREFILDTDASDETIGVVLTQIQTRVEEVIAYCSQTLGKSEQNYCASDKELLVVMYFMEYYKHYLLDQCFRVHSNHKALKWLFSLKETKHRVAMWTEALSEFDFKVEYQQGKKMEMQMHCPGAQAQRTVPALHQQTAEECRLPCKVCKKCLRWAEHMWGELPGVPTTILGNPI